MWAKILAGAAAAVVVGGTGIYLAIPSNGGCSHGCSGSQPATPEVCPSAMSCCEAKAPSCCEDVKVDAAPCEKGECPHAAESK